METTISIGMMSKVWFFTLSILCAACQAPISYINNLPQVSGLSERGDLSIQANWGADATFENPVYDLDLAKALTKNLGLKSHFTFGSKRHYFDQLSYLDLSLVYFGKSSTGMKYEIISGFGAGFLRASSTNFADPYDHHCSCGGLPPVDFSDSDYTAITKSKKFLLQPSISMPLNLTDVNSHLNLGLRAQLVDFSSYYFEQNYKILYNKPITTILLDPFISVDQQFGKVGAQLMAGYSLNLGDRSAHPVYSKLYTSVGLFLRISK
ncbi:MAG: hypothetical protein ABJG41_07900 [Cyclobacteriaceae bacterium]